MSITITEKPVIQDLQRAKARESATRVRFGAENLRDAISKYEPGDSTDVGVAFILMRIRMHLTEIERTLGMQETSH